MSAAALDAAGFGPRPQPGYVRSFALALAVHALLLAVMFLGVRLQSHAPDSVTVELWDPPPPRVEEPPPPPPKAEPEPPKPEPKIEKPEMPIKVQCDAHGWMRGFVYVADNPYYAVTARNGTFSLPEVPPGSYTLVAWQEYAGETEIPVTVEAKKVAQVTVELKKK